MGRSRLAKNRGFPPNLYQNSAGYFYYVNPRSRETKGLGQDKAHAFSEARAANAVLATTRKSSLADWVAGKEDYSLAEWVPIYKELWIGKSKPAAATLRNATGYLDRIAEADFAWMKLRDVTTTYCAKFLDGIEVESGSATRLNMRARMRDVFRMAETQGLRDDNTNPVSATYTPSRAVKRERLTLEQFKLIHAQAPTWLQRAMYLALLTAQRREDIAKMKFSDCKDGFLFIVQGKSKGEIRLQQDVQIRLQAVGMSIDDAIQNCRDLNLSRFIVHHTEHQGSAKPGDRVSVNGLSNAFQTAREAAGITASEGRTPPSFHEIRSLAQRLYRDERGAEFAQEMLGHKNASMTSKYDEMRGKGFKLISAE
jgi:enterobacteria phage integrase